MTTAFDEAIKGLRATGASVSTYEVVGSLEKHGREEGELLERYQRFVDEAVKVHASVIALSTLMTTTMDGMAEVIKLLQQANVRERIKVIVGGGPISQSFANRIGADGYSASAPAAVKLVKQLVGESAR